MEFLGIPIWLFLVMMAVSLLIGFGIRHWLDLRALREKERLKEKAREIKKRMKREKKRAKKTAKGGKGGRKAEPEPGRDADEEGTAQ